MSMLTRFRIRMYRGILGDCFLLRATFAESGTESTRSILIDCGVLQNVSSGKDMIAALPPEIVETVGKKRLAGVVAGPDRIRKVAQDVLHEVGGRIELLIVTHEHYDHLSGFGFAKEAFLDERLKIDRLWMAWTEDPKDKQASALRARFTKGRRALAATETLATRLGANAPSKLQNAAALAAFAGPQTDHGLATAGGGFGTAEIMQMLKKKANVTQYLEPGQVLDLDRFGIRAFVLGPPREERLLRKDTPSRGHAKEVYLTQFDGAAAAESTALAQLSLLARSHSEGWTFGEGSPFAPAHHRRIIEVREPAATLGQTVRDLYYAKAERWRRIDDEWTGSLETLALKMDSDTNNTSLALALELPDGQVLLFPGDAQVGNWLSWNDQTYPTPEEGRPVTQPITAEDLLSRVTFYKAGHHGSHNSTLKALGLERMTDPRLIAAIPVVEAVASVQGKGRSEAGKGWKMPYADLYDALAEKTRGRIVQGDGDPKVERKAFLDNPTSSVRPVTVEHDDLWVELTFELA